MMSFPEWAYIQLPKALPRMEQPAPCFNQSQFGNLTWVINGEEYTFTPEEWIYPPVTGKAAAQISSHPIELTEMKSSNRNSYEQDDVSYIIQDSPAFAQSYLDQMSNSFVQLISQLEPSSNEKDSEPGSPDNGAQCYGSLMQMDLKKEMFVVGDLFMRKYYTIFDRDNNRVGLAKAVNN